MDWFSFIKPKFIEPQMQFGRYSDSFKTDRQMEFWNEATSKFEQGDYLHSYEAFFHYLQDDEENNVSFEFLDNHIVFEIQQGSRVITGKATKESIAAETDVAKFNKLDVVVMRKLLEFNYSLKYSRYSITPDNKINLRFESSTIDGSPEKLYNALREVATHSDKQDDLLISQFNQLRTINNKHVRQLSDAEKEIKQRYIQVWINRAFNLIAQLDSNQYAQIISQILLNVAFKIDYLCVPQGNLMGEIEEIQSIYFAPNGLALTEKNAQIIAKLEGILNTDKDLVFNELYYSKATFGVTRPTLHDVVSQFIDNESPRTSYIKNQQQYQIQLNIQEYIIQYILYYFGINQPSQWLMHLMLQVINYDFFSELGYKPQLYNAVEEKLNKRTIKFKLEQLITEAQNRYQNFNFDANAIAYDSIPIFIETMFKQLSQISYD